MAEFQYPDAVVVDISLNSSIGSRNNETGIFSVGDLGIPSIGE